ncbi:MAG: transketolase C-terminal domain-containing protein, partial [Dehalococcoidia bacterium]|nr:transketolase C-terminal domain-containing protein [Dehalococcoidia bacterium]
REVKLAKQRLGWTFPEPFTIPPEALAHFRLALETGKRRQQEWNGRLEEYGKAYPELAGQLVRELQGDLPQGWDGELAGLFKPGEKPTSTRDASGKALNVISARVPSLAGGSGDLSPSTKTILKNQGDFDYNDYSGCNFHFGVREHSMGAFANGMSRHGGMIPYVATFLIFSDYMRPPMRLAAMMKIRVIYVFTHDSVALGEDGPTHQPIEQLMGLRAIPNMTVIRPADATETVEAWRVALENSNGPTALLLTRQAVPVLDRMKFAPADGLRRGGYVLWQAGPNPDVVLIGTGSEVHIALEAGSILQTRGVIARVVSLPSWSLFDAQPRSYRESVLPPAVRARVSIEAGARMGWEHYLGSEGVAIGLDRFGASAPGPAIYQHLGLTAQRVVEEAMKLVEGK